VSVESIAADSPNITGGTVALLRQPSVTYGVRLRTALTEIVAKHNAQRVLPVVTTSLLGDSTLRDALAVLPGGVAPFSGLKPHTPFEVILALIAELARHKPDMIVVVGGGSATDAAKVATVALAAGVSAHDALLALRALPDARGTLTSLPVSRTMPIVAVPTTLSAAEFGVIAGGTDTATGIKHLFRAETLAPEIVIYDPWFVRATPMDLWLSTGIRSLDHGIETVLSIDANPYTDALALRGLTLLREGLSASYANPDDARARHRAQLGVWLVGCGIGRVRYGASHGLGHQLGAVAGVPHGLTSCVLLPAVLDYNLSHSADQQALIANVLGRPGVAASVAVRDFIASLGLPTRMRDLNVAKEKLPRVAESALGNAFVRANCRPIAAAADVMDVLERAY
jgi:alcohol dehydrogenase class IV